MRRILLSLLVCAAACKNDGSSEPQPKPSDEGPKNKIAGVYPENFKCDSILSPDAVGQLLGGTAKPIESEFRPPRGVPAPCNYEVSGEGFVQAWTFDIDCRDDFKQRADALFAQYASQSAELVESYNQAADAGMIKPNDAGIVNKAPEGASEVAVGAKGLDHHGQGLIFIDDDAPCYVRVVGPEFDKRVALAKAVATKLTFANAPMKPRAMP